MYINERKVSVGKTINTIKLIIWSILLICFGSAFFMLLFEKDWVGSIFCFVNVIIFGTLFFKAIKYYSLMDDMYFYSRYFEGDLDGYMYAADIANTLNSKEKIINKELKKLLKRKYMKNFKLTKENGKVKITLISRVEKCECKNCGAIIDKRVYFTGVCPYCGSSDLFAKEIQGSFSFNRNEITTKHAQGNMYLAKNVRLKENLNLIPLAVLLLPTIISACTLIFGSLDFDSSVLGMSLMITLVQGFIIYLLGENLVYLRYADEYSKRFRNIKTNKPFIGLAELYEYKVTFAGTYNSNPVCPYCGAMLSNSNIIKKLENSDKIICPCCNKEFYEEQSYNETSYGYNEYTFFLNRAYKIDPVKALVKALKKGYLVNCNMEIHNGKIQIALAKEVTKDTCPYCGAPIVGATEKDYVCKYCGSVISDVIVKK